MSPENERVSLAADESTPVDHAAGAEPATSWQESSPAARKRLTLGELERSGTTLGELERSGTTLGELERATSSNSKGDEA